MRRITLDIDDWWFQTLQGMIDKAVDEGLNMPDTIRPSPSGRGYHLVWYGLNITQQEEIELRRKIGDDSRRIFFDIVGHPKQVLFKKKRRYK